MAGWFPSIPYPFPSETHSTEDGYEGNARSARNTPCGFPPRHTPAGLDKSEVSGRGYAREAGRQAHRDAGSVDTSNALLLGFLE